MFNVEKTLVYFLTIKYLQDVNTSLLYYSADRTETTWKWQGETLSNFHVWASAYMCLFTGYPHATQNSKVSTLPLKHQQYFLTRAQGWTVRTPHVYYFFSTLNSVPSSILDLLLTNRCPSSDNFQWFFFRTMESKTTGTSEFWSGGRAHSSQTAARKRLLLQTNHRARFRHGSRDLISLGIN